MKTELIRIPVREMTLDPHNKAQVSKVIEMADAKFRLSASAWERGNNSGDPIVHNAQNNRSRRLAKDGEALLSPLGIKVTWPGLAPAFEVHGFHEYTTTAAVLTALGRPRNWLYPEGSK